MYCFSILLAKVVWKLRLVFSTHRISMTCTTLSKKWGYDKGVVA